MRYGVPYKGSKNKIAPWVVEHLPEADTLIDLFAGGCAVSHAAMLSGKYKCIHLNDIDDAPQLFLDVLHGKCVGENRWISRDDFFRLKDHDPFIRYVWSSGTTGEIIFTAAR